MEVAFGLLGIILDVSLLGFFKACGVLKLGIIIPIGLSYFVFKLISYQVDSFRGMISGTSFIDLANYLLMFPQIISGPIARFNYIIENDFLA
jgi:Predicted membrane protein involved in D-alanine export